MNRKLLNRRSLVAIIALMVVLFLVGCNAQPNTPVPEVRPTMTQAMPTAIPASAVPRTIGDVLVGHRWNVQSNDLAGQSFVAEFYQGGRFDAIVIPSRNDEFNPKHQQISGIWHVAGSLLTLKWKEIWPQTGLSNFEATIEITDLSSDKLEGLSNAYNINLWEFDKTDAQ